MSVSSRSILEGLQIGNALGAPIGQGLARRGQQDFERQMEEERFKQALQKTILENPNLLAGGQQIQPGQSVDGQKSVNPLALTPEQQADYKASGDPNSIREVPTIEAGGMAFNPQAIKSANIDDELRKFKQQKELHQIISQMSPSQWQLKEDTTTGKMYRINKLTNQYEEVGATPSGGLMAPKPVTGSVQKDEQGNVYVVDPRLQQGSQPGQSSQVTQGGSPLTLGSKGDAPAQVQDRLNKMEPVKHYNEVVERADAIPALLQQAQRTGNYTTADSAINEELQRLVSNQAIRGNAMNLMYKGQSLADKIEGFFTQFKEGGNKYTDATRQDAMLTAQTLLGVAKNNRDKAISGVRESYPNKDVFDSRISPAFPGFSVSSPVATPGINPAAPSPVGRSGTTPSGIKFKAK